MLSSLLFSDCFLFYWLILWKFYVASPYPLFLYNKNHNLAFLLIAYTSSLIGSKLLLFNFFLFPSLFLILLESSYFLLLFYFFLFLSRYIGYCALPSPLKSYLYLLLILLSRIIFPSGLATLLLVRLLNSYSDAAPSIFLISFNSRHL